MLVTKIVETLPMHSLSYVPHKQQLAVIAQVLSLDCCKPQLSIQYPASQNEQKCILKAQIEDKKNATTHLAASRSFSTVRHTSAPLPSTHVQCSRACAIVILITNDVRLLWESNNGYSHLHHQCCSDTASLTGVLHAKVRYFRSSLRFQKTVQNFILNLRVRESFECRFTLASDPRGGLIFTPTQPQGSC